MGGWLARALALLGGSDGALGLNAPAADEARDDEPVRGYHASCEPPPRPVSPVSSVPPALPVRPGDRVRGLDLRGREVQEVLVEAVLGEVAIGTARLGGGRHRLVRLALSTVDRVYAPDDEGTGLAGGG